MSWKIFPKEVQGIIISYLDFNDNFFTLSQVDFNFLQLTLQFINCKDEATADFCNDVYNFIFALEKNEKTRFYHNKEFNTGMLTSFLKNESINKHS